MRGMQLAVTAHLLSLEYPASTVSHVYMILLIYERYEGEFIRHEYQFDNKNSEFQRVMQFSSIAHVNP